MPATKKLPSLVQISLESLSDKILELVFDGEQTEATVRNRVRSLEELLSSSLEKGVHDALSRMLWIKLSREFEKENNSRRRQTVRWVLPSLLGKSLKALNFSNCKMIGDKTLMTEMYQTFDERCPNLERLTMGQSFFFQPELVSRLNEKLAKLTKLVSLKIMYIAVNTMLADISKNCPRLVELCLKGSEKIDDVSADEISACKKLRILDIQGTKISYVGCLKILESCQNLEWVDHCPANCDSDLPLFRTRKEMFELIKKGFASVESSDTANFEQNLTEVRRSKPFNIKNFWLFNPKSDELRVYDHCPKLERIRLDFVFQDMNFQLEAAALSNFRHLNTLDLNFYDNHDNPLLDRILESCGHKLRTLIYSVCAEYRSIVDCHNIIAKRCHNLTSLTFNNGDYESLAHLDQETDGLLGRRDQDWQPHPRLQSLSLAGYCTDGRLAWLLSGSPDIRHVNLDGNLERLSDQAWRDIMVENQLESLESVWFNTSTNMSMASVRELLRVCPRLRRLGRLIHLREHAGGERRENYLDLLERTGRENWELDTTWVTPANKMTF